MLEEQKENLHHLVDNNHIQILCQIMYFLRPDFSTGMATMGDLMLFSTTEEVVWLGLLNLNAWVQSLAKELLELTSSKPPTISF